MPKSKKRKMRQACEAFRRNNQRRYSSYAALLNVMGLHYKNELNNGNK